MHVLVCSHCKQKTPFTQEYQIQFSEGIPPACKTCEEISNKRVENNRRALPIGVFRPDIVLYGEPHANGELVAEICMSDIKKKPDLLVIMGTSLKIPGGNNF